LQCGGQANISRLIVKWQYFLPGASAPVVEIARFHSIQFNTVSSEEWVKSRDTDLAE